MDELVHHCLRELSFDGDLGCDVSRLQDFIIGFYARSNSQVVDEAFCAFVWSLVVQQSTVRIGTVPPGITSEVYLAPQTSAKRKAKARGEEHVVEQPPELDIIPDANTRSLHDLKQQYGNMLRIAVDPETCFAAVTGSHIRPTKLSPMVYTALQIITRGRDNGITVVELGQKSKYDQKTCFYLVKQLIELNLVLKLKRGGVGSHFCIHKYFFERSELWQEIRNEELEADVEVEARHLSEQPQLADEGDAPDTENADIQFEPIDARHLSSLPLIRARIVKLLKASKNYLYPANNLVVILGFKNPTKTDRRFFQTRIRELIQQGVVEKVLVPSKKGGNTQTKCLRLVTSDTPSGIDKSIVVPDLDDEKDVEFSETLEGQSVVRSNMTLHKQISDLLENAGTRGMTLVEIVTSLGHFDKRTIELLLTRATKYPPPDHLSDLGTAELMETHGRERRHRYYTIASYKALVAKEHLDETSSTYTGADFSNVGGFLSIDEGVFWKGEDDLRTFQDSFNAQEKVKSRKANNKPRNPLLSDGTVKIGRPRKNSGDLKKPRQKAKGEQQTDIGDQGSKRKREAGDEGDSDDDAQGDGFKEGEAGPPKARRGRPPKKRLIDDDVTEVKAPKKRGRPSKPKPSDSVGANSGQGSEQPSIPKKRGRPPKKNVSVVEEPGAVAESSATAIVELPPVAGHPSIGHGTGVETGVRRTDELPKVSVLEHPQPNMITSEDSHEQPLASSLSENNSPRRSARKPKPTIREENSISPRKSRSKINIPTSEPSAPAPEPMVVDNLPRYPTPTQGLLNSFPHTFNTLPEPSTAIPDVGAPQLQLDIVDPSSYYAPIDPTLVEDASMSVTQQETQSNELKRINADADIDSPSSKRVKLDTSGQSSRPKLNVSHLRRENELYRVIELSGGIANVSSKEFFETHLSLLATMNEAGEPTSAPVGIRIDKRTADATLNNLAGRGRIKTLKTSVILPTGTSRPVCIAYLSEIEQDQLNSFLTDLSQSIPAQPPIKKIENRIEYGLYHREKQKQASAAPRADRADLDTGALQSIQDQPKAEKKLARARRRAQKKAEKEDAQKALEAKSNLARKVADAKAQKEQDWEDIFRQVHPEPLEGSLLKRMRRVRTRFLQSSSHKDSQKWISEITDTIREANMAATKLLKRTTPKSRPAVVVPPPIVSNPPEKSVRALIEQQGPALAVSTKKRSKRKEKARESEEPAGRVRRHRFTWNKDYDELARDASAIARARCRDLPRLDLSSIDQVFPAVPRNSVRQRMAHMRETPATDAYMKRLEDQWYCLWVQHRGTDLLSDNDLKSASNFNLIEHIEFLRRHIDKNALRVGFTQVDESNIAKIPATVEQLIEEWDVIEPVPTAPMWEFMWNSNVEEGREKNLLQRTFSLQGHGIPGLGNVPSEEILRAEAALKMTFGTPSDHYEPEVAARLLHSVGDEAISDATSNLLSRGVLAKLVRDSTKSKPGRTLKISDINQNALGGSLPCDTFQDATAIDEFSSQQDWREWPLLASDGDLAALVEFVSENDVEFKIDTTQARAARPAIDWNSKKADDDQIEIAIQVRFRGTMEQPTTPENVQSSAATEANAEESGVETGHGITLDGDAACCRKHYNNPVDCSACLETEVSLLLAGLNEADKILAFKILSGVFEGASKGITKKQLLMKTNANEEQISCLVTRMIESGIVFWTGYSSLVLVSAHYLSSWAVTIREDPTTKILPRRWLDITGAKMTEIWEAALRAVMGTLIFRPGVSQTEICWQMRSVYDRQEINEILQYLEDEGYADRRARYMWPLDGEEEKDTFWFAARGHWYQVA